MQEAETDPRTSRQDYEQGGQRRDYVAGQRIFPHGDPRNSAGCGAFNQLDGGTGKDRLSCTGAMTHMAGDPG